jgi:ubiquinone/menaquinone biosynthesis C-methylase UbiE
MSDRSHDEALARLRAVGYGDEEIASVPVEAAAGRGCGNPVGLATLRAGETVLDLGCGTGFDVFLAAAKVGECGRVIGLDADAEVIERASGNACKGGYSNVSFEVGDVARVPLDGGSVDVIISNCVISDVHDKLAAWSEAFRVLKPGGRVMIADLVIEGPAPAGGPDTPTIWHEWLAGALDHEAYLALVRKAGFADIAVIAERLFTELAVAGGATCRVTSIALSARKPSEV